MDHLRQGKVLDKETVFLLAYFFFVRNIYTNFCYLFGITLDSVFTLDSKSWRHGWLGRFSPYIKNEDISLMNSHKQVSWVVRKIFEAIKTLRSFTGGTSVLWCQMFSIRKVYRSLRGNAPSVPWRKLTCNNPAPPKCVFICWLVVLGRLSTCDNLLKVCVTCDQVCIFCKQHDETLSHLFSQCSFTSSI